MVGECRELGGVDRGPSVGPLESAAMELDTISKASDVSGRVPAQIDRKGAERIGAAFARYSGASERAIGRDCRTPTLELAAGASGGSTSQDCDVHDPGMITIGMLYCTAIVLDVPGSMMTAAHDLKGHTGIKVCLAGAMPVGEGSGLLQLRAVAEGPDGGGGKDFELYGQSGEINFSVDDVTKCLAIVASAFSQGGLDRLDGLTVDLGGCGFNLRLSNTMPVVRLNAEAGDAAGVASRYHG
jgi:phosphomannomutase